VLEVLAETNHPVGIVTKSALVQRTSTSWPRWRARDLRRLRSPSRRSTPSSRAAWSRVPRPLRSGSRDQDALGSRHSGQRARRARDPGAERPRDRVDPRGLLRGRRPRGRLRAPAAAARVEGPRAGLARRELPGPHEARALRSSRARGTGSSTIRPGASGRRASGRMPG
jgi:hypothetical protein